MNDTFLGLITKFARFGVLHREDVKNNLKSVMWFIHRGYIQKVHRNGRIFYELTAKATPLLEHHRKKLLEEIQMLTLIDKERGQATALVTNVRFFDETKPGADSFLFLGDFLLTRPVVQSQLELSKLRFYRERVAPRRRQVRAA